MRRQNVGQYTDASLARWAERSKITEAEKEIVVLLTELIPFLKWGTWSMFFVEGFRAITPNNYEISIRRFEADTRHARNWTWYGIDPKAAHWYFVQVNDLLKRTSLKRKAILDFAAAPDDSGYEELKTVFDTVVSKYKAGETGLKKAPTHLLKKMGTNAEKCVTTHPLFKAS